MSGTFQSIPDDERIWTYTVTRALVPALSTVSAVSARLNEPGSQYFARINQTDVSLAGTIRAGKVRIKPQMDLFNLFNVNPILTEIGSYPIQDRPRTILAGRVIRFSVSVPYGG